MPDGTKGRVSFNRGSTYLGRATRIMAYFGHTSDTSADVSVDMSDAVAPVRGLSKPLFS